MFCTVVGYFPRTASFYALRKIEKAYVPDVHKYTFDVSRSQIRKLKWLCIYLVPFNTGIKYSDTIEKCQVKHEFIIYCLTSQEIFIKNVPAYIILDAFVDKMAAWYDSGVAIA